MKNTFVELPAAPWWPPLSSPQLSPDAEEVSYILKGYNLDPTFVLTRDPQFFNQSGKYSLSLPLPFLASPLLPLPNLPTPPIPSFSFSFPPVSCFFCMQKLLVPSLLFCPPAKRLISIVRMLTQKPLYLGTRDLQSLFSIVPRQLRKIANEVSSLFYYNLL